LLLLRTSLKCRNSQQHGCGHVRKEGEEEAVALPPRMSVFTVQIIRQHSTQAAPMRETPPANK